MTKNKRHELRISEQDLQEIRAFARKNKTSISEVMTKAALDYVRTGTSDVRTIRANEVDNVRTDPKPKKAKPRAWKPYDKKAAAK